MTFDEYNDKACVTSEYPMVGANIVYPAMGLAGEAGELLDKIKKHWRNEHKYMSANESNTDAVINSMSGYSVDNTLKDEIVKEMGDVLWYLAALCRELHINFNEVAIENIHKLTDRKQRGVVCSEGDNR